jgi:SAM-dependent methyltransferase
MDSGQMFSAEHSAPKGAGAQLDRLMSTMRAFMESRCLLTALELDIFSAVGDGADSRTIASRIHSDGRATGILLNALAGMGMLEKKGDLYRNAPETARYFSKGSPENVRDGMLHNANIWHRWGTLTDVVRGGRPIHVRAEENPEWTRNFISAMDRNARDRAPLLVKELGGPEVRRVLDLGGGSAIYSIAFAKAFPGVRCVILDLPEVVTLTEQYVSRAGASDQVSVRGGSMLTDDYGSGFDLILLNAICHMFSEAQNREIFGRARRALGPKGRLSVQDFILDPDRTGPLHAALFAINMLVGTEGGNTYTESDYAEWMQEAGFEKVRRIHLTGPADLIVGVAP